MSLVSGVYTLHNKSNDNQVLDLSGVDNTTLLGYQDCGSSNQQWQFTSMYSDDFFNFYIITNMANNRYVGIVDGAPVGVTDINSASLWRISNQLENPGNPTATIIAPQTHTAFTLNSHGVVTLTTNYDRANQLWTFDRVFSTGDEE